MNLFTGLTNRFKRIHINFCGGLKWHYMKFWINWTDTHTINIHFLPFCFNHSTFTILYSEHSKSIYSKIPKIVKSFICLLFAQYHVISFRFGLEFVVKPWKNRVLIKSIHTKTKMIIIRIVFWCVFDYFM